MQGSEHSDAPHQVVTRNIISNLKLKDKRESAFLSNVSSGRKSNVTEISDLFSSFNESGNGNSIFFLNAREIVTKNTKFGNLFANTGPELFNQIIDNLRFRLIVIDRHKVRTIYSNNKLKETKALQTKRVISAHENEVAELTIMTGGGSLKRTLFPFDTGIFSYEFVDPEMTTSLKGEYKYSVTFNFSDPTVILAREMMKEMSDAIKSLGRYIGRIKRQLKLKDTDFSPPLEWVSGEKSRFSEDPGSAPWIMAPMVYSKYKKMFFNVTEIERIKIESDRITAIEPSTFTINAINNFKSELNNLYRYVDSLFGLQTSSANNYNVRSQPKTKTITNLISKKYSFAEVLVPSQNEKFYTFLQPAADSSFTKKISLSDFRDRINVEREKFFDDISQNQSPEDVIQDTSTSMASYFTPYSIKDDKGVTIDLKNIQEIDRAKFNNFFENVKKPRFKKPRKDINSSFNIRPMSFVLESDPYVESSEYLGKSSIFNSYADIDSSVKPIKAKKETLSKVKNKVSKKQTTSKQKFSLKAPINIFNKKNLDRAPKSLGGIAMVPNQLRALNFNSINGAKQILSEEELLTPENDLLVSVNYLTLRQFEFLVDFEQNSEGIKVMKRPTWQVVTTDVLESLSVGSFCKIEEVKSTIVNYEVDQRTVLPHADKYFILTDQPLSSTGQQGPGQEGPEAPVPFHIEQYNATSNFNIIGSTTEVVVQNITKESEIFKVQILQNETPGLAVELSQNISRGNTRTSGY